MTIEGGDIIALITGGVITQSPIAAPAVGTETPTALDTEMRQVAFDLIDEFGKTLTYNMNLADTFDPATGGVTAGSPASVNRKSIPPYKYEDQYIDGDLIRVGDMQTGVAALGLTFTPEKQMVVNFDNLNWDVKAVNPIYSGTQIALYILQLRR